MKAKYKHRIEDVYFYNRWLDRRYSRPSTWTIVGIHQHWAGPEDYCYRFCFFGLEMSVWIKRSYIYVPFDMPEKDRALMDDFFKP